MKQGKNSWWSKMRIWAGDNIPVVIIIVALIVWGFGGLCVGFDRVNPPVATFASITSLIGSVIAAFTWYSVRRMRNSLKPVEPGQLEGDDVAILCVTCKNGDDGKGISAEVANYLYTNMNAENIAYYQRDTLTRDKTLGEFNMPDYSGGEGNQFTAQFLTEISDRPFGYGRFISVTVSGRMPLEYAGQYTTYFGMCMEETFRRLKALGINKFKLFYNGPVLLPAIIGDLAKNNAALELYHWDRAYGYVSMGLMQLSWRVAWEGKTDQARRTYGESESVEAERPAE